MSGIEVRRTHQFIAEWAEPDDNLPRIDEWDLDVELRRIVRFRIEGPRRVEPRPLEHSDPEAMRGEPLF